MEDYTNIDKKIKSLLAEMSNGDKTKNGYVEWLFDRIELDGYDNYLKILD